MRCDVMWCEVISTMGFSTKFPLVFYYVLFQDSETWVTVNYMHDCHSLFPSFLSIIHWVYPSSPHICITFHTRIRAQYSRQRNMLNIRQMQVHVAAESCSPLHLHPPAYIYTRNIGRLYFYFYSFHYWKRTPSFSFLFSFLFVFVITVVSLDAMQCLTRNDVRAILPLSPLPALFGPLLGS